MIVAGGIRKVRRRQAASTRRGGVWGVKVEFGGQGRSGFSRAGIPPCRGAVRGFSDAGSRRCVDRL